MGRGAEEVKEPTWPYYKSLNFLTDSVKPRKTLSNRKGCAPSTSGDDDQEGGGMSSAQNEIIMQRALTVLEDTKKAERNEDDIFGELIAQKMKKLPDSDEKEELKLEIQSLILRHKKYSS